MDIKGGDTVICPWLKVYESKTIKLLQFITNLILKINKYNHAK